jgi:hypothetical protein
VARQLEREREAALAERAHLGEEYERHQRQRPARLSAAELAAIRALASDIPALWAAPATTTADRKRLIRAVIESVQVTADGATERVHAAITWAGGHQTHAALSRPVARIDQLSYYPALTERIRSLARQGLDSAAIAGQLAAEGFRTPRLHDRFHPGEIQHLIRQLGLRPGLDHDHRTDQGSLGPGQWWLAPWPARSACRWRPCSGGSDAAGSPAGKTPGRPTGGSSPQTPPKPNASACCTSCRPATTTSAAGPTTAFPSAPRRTRSPVTMDEETYAARTEATTSRPGCHAGCSGRRTAAPGRDAYRGRR